MIFSIKTLHLFLLYSKIICTKFYDKKPTGHKLFDNDDVAISNPTSQLEYFPLIVNLIFS